MVSLASPAPKPQRLTGGIYPSLAEIRISWNQIGISLTNNSKDVVDTLLMEEVHYTLERCYRERTETQNPRGKPVITESGISVKRAVCVLVLPKISLGV